MADWTDLSSSFGAYETLSSANMQQLRDNITAAFEQSSGAPQLANFYIQDTMIDSWAVTSTKIDEYSITSRHIINGSIGTVSLHADCITGDKIADNAVSSEHIASGAIGEAGLGASTVSQGKLKTTTEEESADCTHNTWTEFSFSSAGEYSFYPQIKCEASTIDVHAQIMMFADGPTAYGTTVSVQQNTGDDRFVYAQIRYVTASGTFAWVFFLVNKDS